MIVPAVIPQPTAVIDHYQELDRFYRELWGEHVHHGLWYSGRESPQVAAEQLVEYVAGLAAVKAGDRVCDIGSGYGATARLLARRFGARVTALTLVPAQQAFALTVEPGAGNPQYLLRDWLDNGLPDAAFNAALAIESTEHMGDKHRAFTEAYRVLYPAGRLVIGAWIAAEQPARWERRWLLEPICQEGRLPGLGSQSEYVGLLQAAGFGVERSIDLSAAVRATWGICLRRVAKRLIADPGYRSFLANRASHNRVFLLTLMRIWLAYRVGALRYMVFVAQRPPDAGPP